MPPSVVGDLWTRTSWKHSPTMEVVMNWIGLEERIHALLQEHSPTAGWATPTQSLATPGSVPLVWFEPDFGQPLTVIMEG